MEQTNSTGKLLNYFLTTYYIWQKHTKEHTKEPNTKDERSNEEEPKNIEEERRCVENKNEAAPQPKQPKQPKQRFPIFC